ncbi:MAG: HEAT repeat domain-containing protein [Desulfuromonadales bacterium]|jgi:HEAT repeat protein
MQNGSQLHNLIATALGGIIKQIKAIRYYPPNHPALQAAAEECVRGFEPILAGGEPLSLEIRKDAFLLEDTPVAKGNQVLSQLSGFCFARRIKYLTFLADLNSRDLHLFVRYLLLDPQQIHEAGGIQTILEQARVTTIWTNVRDLAEILARREEIEEQPEVPDVDPEALLDDEAETESEVPEDMDSFDLETLIDALEREEDDSRFRHMLHDLLPHLRVPLEEDQRPQVLRIFLLLCRTATGAKLSKNRRDSAQEGLSELATEQMTHYLVDYFFAEDTPPKTQDMLLRILAYQGKKAARYIMPLLINEESAARRKLLCTILIRSGPDILPTVHEFLNDDRWFVVRNTATIIGEIRNPASLDELSSLLQHDDIRVRREAIRALAKIGGTEATEVLQQAAESEDYELRRQAILSLGAMRASAATPTLLAILGIKGWNPRDIDLKKDAIRALGEIRDPAAIAELVKILDSKSWLQKQLNDDLRIAAAAALGEFADENTRTSLTRATNDRNAAIARAAAQSLKQLDKATP